MTTPTASKTVSILDAPPAQRPLGPKTVVTPSSSSWAAEYPFRSHFLEVPLLTGEGPVEGAVNGAATTAFMHFIDEGPRDAPVLVFHHGNPSWSFYWRNLVLALRDRYRCVVVDHVGMGLSDRPQMPRFLLQGHVDRVCAVIAALGLQRFSVIGHDWGGCIAAGVAGRMPEKIDSIVWMNTAAFLSQDIPPSIRSCRIPLFGAVAVRGLNGFAGAAIYRGVEKHERMTPVVKAGLLAPYGNWHDRIATLRFVEDIPLKPTHPSYDELARIENNLGLLKNKPVALFWGDADWCFTPKFRKRFEVEFPRAEVHAWEDCGHYVVEDAHERIVPLITAFFDRHAGSPAASSSPSSSSPSSPTAAA